MKRAIALTALAALAACAPEAAQSNGADDFAARVGTSGAGAEQAAASVDTVAYEAPPAPGSDVTQLEQLGNIANVDLGPRAGGCTFSSSGTEMLVAAGPQDRALPGKATVRVGGQLLLLDAPPGGYDIVKTGTTFNGQGFSVLVTPGEGGTASMIVTDAEGRQRQFDGRYVCS